MENIIFYIIIGLVVLGSIFNVIFGKSDNDDDMLYIFGCYWLCFHDNN